MKQIASVKAFKNEMRNYKFYIERIKGLNELIELCYDMLGASPKGIDPSKEMSSTHTPPNLDVIYRVRDEIERHEHNKSLVVDKVKYIDKVLGTIEEGLRMAIIDVYVEGQTMDKVSKKMYLSKSTLRNYVDRELKKALED